MAAYYTSSSIQRDGFQMMYPGDQTTAVSYHQGLSLSLGNEIQLPVSNPSFQHHHPSMEPIPYKHLIESARFDNANVLHSKYLKPAQQLLDEAVNIRKQTDQNKLKRNNGFGSKNSTDIDAISAPCNLPELSPSERQDLQNKKTKLLSMLDEVDKKYSQYYHHMQFLTSSFEMAAGLGAAKPYTSVALQSISRHFRCLRDTIKTQIRATRIMLGEQETSLEDQGETIPRLRHVDQQIRQNKAFHQQFGAMRHVWRTPQRGLPESSVSILRAWLFEHFLHPYPKDSEKIMLARQTGLTRNQVANWFINARVRLWKPMIEEMYKQEFGDSEAKTKSCLEKEQKDQTESFVGSEFKGKEVLQESKTSMASDAHVNSNCFIGSSMVDYYHNMGLGTQQDRFCNPCQFHDFVV